MRDRPLFSPDRHGRHFLGSFPGFIAVVVHEGHLVLTLRPLDDGRGEAWEVHLPLEAVGLLCAGHEHGVHIAVYQAPEETP